MGELGAEAQVGVQEVEQEVERPLLHKVGDEPGHTIISLSLMVDGILILTTWTASCPSRGVV